MRAGEDVRKYGWPIGRATRDIAAGRSCTPGTWRRGSKGPERISLRAGPKYCEARALARQPPRAPHADSPPRAALFMGYRRANGRESARATRSGFSAPWAASLAPPGASRAPGLRSACRDASTAFRGVHASFGCSQLGDDLRPHTRHCWPRLADASECRRRAHRRPRLRIETSSIGCSRRWKASTSHAFAPSPRKAPATKPSRGLAALEELVAIASRDPARTLPSFRARRSA